MATPDLKDAQPQEPGGGEPPVRGPRAARAPMLLLAVLAVVVVAVGAVVLLGGSSSKKTSAVSSAATQSARRTALDGSALVPQKAAPALGLRNFDGGRRVSIADFRGKAVFVTFIYTHCPDVCPLIASNLGVAYRLLGARAGKTLQLLAVSVDPRGDTPRTVAKFLKEREDPASMLYTIGSLHELGRVWRAWNVGSEKDAKDPEFIDHSALVYGIDGRGRITTVYPANFKPAEIAHDAPLLAAQ